MLLIASLIITIVLAGIEVDIFTPSFPELIKQFDLDEFQVQLTLSLNFMTFCLSSLVVGTLGDRYGRRNVILISLIIVIIGSIACAFAVDFWMILVGRLCQGLGMAGPAVLAYVVIADRYSEEEQTRLMAMLNGLIAGSMAFAPIIGSFVNMFYGWRGNFHVLLIVSLIAFTVCYFTIPRDEGNKDVKLSVSSYTPLLKNRLLILYAASIAFVVLGYWVFVAFSPILFMRDMGVRIEYFGLYQGALCASFSLTSMCSTWLFKRFSNMALLKFGSWASLLGTGVALGLAVAGSDTPLTITIALCVFGVGNVFPIAILYPVCIGLMPEAKGRAASMVMAIRLILNAIVLQSLSLVYKQRYLEIGILVFGSTLIAFIMFMYLPEWRIRKNCVEN